MKKWILAGVAVALVATHAVAQKARLTPECRKEVRALCVPSGGRPERGAIKSCLTDKASQLSQGCRAELMERIKQKRGNAPQQSPSEGASEISYGADAKQRLDFYPAKDNAKAGLVVFVHGGGWSIGDKSNGTGTKPAFYNGLGYAFASINYRLVPQVKPGDQAQDVASAIAALRKDAARLGFDPDRIILMGHSAGAHLAALVSSDTRYLQNAGVPLAAIKGTVLLDGAGYDVGKQMASKDNKLPGMYDAAFGKDPAVQKTLSPISYISAPNAANWLLLYVDSRPDSRAQSEALAVGLNSNGARTTLKAVPNSSHMSVNTDAGVAGSFVGSEIAAFAKRAL